MKISSKGEHSIEALLHKRAWQARPDFSKRHLVHQPYPPILMIDGRSIMFQETGSDFHSIHTLGELPERYQASGCKKATFLILREWNDLTNAQSRITTASEYLKMELRHSLSVGRSAYRWAKAANLLPSDAPFIRVNFRDRELNLPNPIQVATDDHRMQGIHLEYLEGLTHGDLHLDNAVVPWPISSGPRIEQLRFIDLSAFSDSAPLTRDIVTLLLSCVFRSMRSGLSQKQQESSIALLIDHDAKLKDYPPDSLVDTIAEIAQIAEALPKQWKQRWHAQYLLSLQAQSLTYTSYENVGERGRGFFFQLAAHAAEAFLESQGNNSSVSF
ncbi:hypothetical protein [Streptomyces sp. SID12501]|uniref:Aminoglycoside phosphotransferase domain-containing protein n=1 Tax=Streptomyces sp. SID12501 TaxID=2706042 RepID=A0A6B3C776_9ACTN|nr:hypothetical protein [Streptomyces sp. SID12501]NEC92172.1 hypothetical protein [Streptomyces sp. SID12501]